MFEMTVTYDCEFQQVFYGVRCGFDAWSPTLGLHQGRPSHGGNEAEIVIIAIKKKFLLNDSSAQFLSLLRERRNV